jgi:hypothetical protein
VAGALLAMLISGLVLPTLAAQTMGNGSLTISWSKVADGGNTSPSTGGPSV